MKTSMLIAALLMSGLTFAQNITHMWSNPMQGSGTDAVLSVSSDANGNVYETGIFSNTVDFDPGAGTNNITSNGAYDIYVRKSDPFGNMLWTVRAGGTGNDVPHDIQINSAGEVFVTGYFTSTVDFDPGSGTTTLSTTAGSGVFLWKLTDQGSLVWAKGMSASAATINEGYSLAFGTSGRIIIGGVIRNSFDADPGAGTATISPGSSANHSFVICLDANGDYVWSSVFSGAGTSICYSLVATSTGEVCMTGNINGTVDVDPGAGTVNLVSAGQSDFFVVKLNASGNYLWSARAGSTFIDLGNGISIDGNDNVYITGGFAGTVDFDPSGTTSNVTSNGSFDCFIWKLNSSGALSMIKTFGGSSYDVGLSISIDASGNIAIGGQFIGTTDLDPNAGTANFTTPNIYEDGFFSKLTAAGNYVYGGQFGGNGQTEAVNDIQAGAGNNIYLAGQFTSSFDANPTSGTQNIVSMAGTRDGYVTRLNECNSAPSVPSIISGATSICGGSVNTYSVTNSGTTTYSWTFPAGWTSTGNSNSISATSTTSSGTVSVVAQNGCGTSAASTLTVTSYTLPATPSAINAAPSPCVGFTTLYSVTAVAGNTYNWTFPAGFTGTSTTNTVSVVPSATAGTVSVTATNVCGTSGASTFVVTPQSSPSAPTSISGNDTICNNTTATFSVTNTAGVTYAWTLPVGWTGSSTTNSISAVANSSGTVSVTAGNGCGTSAPTTMVVTVINAPGTLASINAQNTICEGTSQVYSTTNYPNCNYTWSIPGGWSGTSSTNSLTATAGNTGGVISVFASNNCGTSNTETLTISVNTIPNTPVSISGLTTVCANSLETYTATATPNATAYTWTLPNMWSGTSTNNTINVTTANQSGTIQVTADNSCGSSAPASITVTADSIPLAPSSINGPNALCENSAFAYSCSPVNNANTYNWTFPSSWTGTGNTQSVSGISGNTGGVITVEAINSCGTSAPSTFNVSINPMPINTISFNNWYLESDQITANYQWIDCNNNFNPVLGATQQQFVPATNGDYAVIIDLNGCVDTSTCIQFLSSDITENPHSNIRIYPNPASDLININGMGATNDIEIRDISGRTVVKLSNVSGAIDISGLSAGSYLMVIDTENEILTKTFIKE